MNTCGLSPLASSTRIQPFQPDVHPRGAISKEGTKPPCAHCFLRAFDRRCRHNVESRSRYIAVVVVVVVLTVCFVPWGMKVNVADHVFERACFICMLRADGFRSFFCAQDTVRGWWGRERLDDMCSGSSSIVVLMLGGKLLSNFFAAFRSWGALFLRAGLDFNEQYFQILLFLNCTYIVRTIVLFVPR